MFNMIIYKKDQLCLTVGDGKETKKNILEVHTSPAHKVLCNFNAKPNVFFICVCLSHRIYF